MSKVEKIIKSKNNPYNLSNPKIKQAKSYIKSNSNLPKIIVDFFSKINILDNSIEKIRLKLNSITNFSPQNLFNAFDKNNKKFLTLSDFKYILRDNKISFSENNLRKFIHNFDKDNDFSINFNEFKGIITPKNNNKNIDLDLNLDEKKIFCDLIISELNFVEKVSELSEKVKDYKDFTTYEAFKEIVGKEKYITKENLGKYFSNNGVGINKEDIDKIMYRLDKDDDGMISYEEFKDIFFPLNNIIFDKNYIKNENNEKNLDEIYNNYRYKENNKENDKNILNIYNTTNNGTKAELRYNYNFETDLENAKKIKRNKRKNKSEISKTEIDNNLSSSIYLFRENYKNSTEISNNNNYKYNTRSKYKSVSNNSYYTHYSNNNLLEQTKSVLGINYNLRKIANNYKNRKKKVVEIEYENDENIIYNKLNKLTRKKNNNNENISDSILNFDYSRYSNKDKKNGQYYFKQKTNKSEIGDNSTTNISKISDEENINSNINNNKEIIFRNKNKVKNINKRNSFNLENNYDKIFSFKDENKNINLGNKTYNEEDFNNNINKYYFNYNKNKNNNNKEQKYLDSLENMNQDKYNKSPLGFKKNKNTYHYNIKLTRNITKNIQEQFKYKKDDINNRCPKCKCINKDECNDINNSNNKQNLNINKINNCFNKINNNDIYNKVKPNKTFYKSSSLPKDFINKKTNKLNLDYSTNNTSINNNTYTINKYKNNIYNKATYRNSSEINNLINQSNSYYFLESSYTNNNFKISQVNDKFSCLYNLFLDYIKQDNNVESIRQLLSQREDANLVDLFSIFTKSGNKLISSSNFLKILNELGIVINMDDIKFLFRKFNKKINEYIDFEEFCEIVLPKKYSNEKIMSEKGSPTGGRNNRYHFEILEETKKILGLLFKNIIDGEKSNEKFRKILSENEDHSGFDLFNKIKKNYSIGIYKEDIANFMKKNKYKLNNKEIELLMERFDKNKDGMIDYKEFIIEISPMNI